MQGNDKTVRRRIRTLVAEADEEHRHEAPDELHISFRRLLRRRHADLSVYLRESGFLYPVCAATGGIVSYFGCIVLAGCPYTIRISHSTVLT